MKPKSITELVAASRQKSYIAGWTKYECGIDVDELPPLELEGYDNAAESYEVWREAAIREFSQKRQ